MPTNTLSRRYIEKLRYRKVPEGMLQIDETRGGTLTEISEERLKRFWEWCGFTCGMECTEDGGFRYTYPELTLDNLFKRAVPKVLVTHDVCLRSDGDTYIAELSDDPLHIVSVEGWNDPAIAVFLAIEKLIEEIG